MSNWYKHLTKIAEEENEMGFYLEGSNKEALQSIEQEIKRKWGKQIFLLGMDDLGIGPDVSNKSFFRILKESLPENGFTFKYDRNTDLITIRPIDEASRR